MTRANIDVGDEIDLQAHMLVRDIRRRAVYGLANTMMLESVITCPHCTTAKLEIMPTDACRVFYECIGCGAVLRPKQDDCCCVAVSPGHWPLSRSRPMRPEEGAYLAHR